MLDLIHDSIAIVTTAALAGPAAVAALFRPQTPTDESSTAFGTARWATRRDCRKAKLLHPDGLVLGRATRAFGSGPLLRVKTDRHLLTLAATRSGKTVGTAIPNVLTFPGSVLVIDTKGEIAEATFEARRAMGHHVHVLDPWGITGISGGGFNPFDLIDITHLDLADDAMMIADLLVAEDGVESGDSVFWENETRALLAGFILFIKTTAPPERQNCAYLRHLLTLPVAPFAALLEEMSQSSASHGLVARAANRLLQKPDRERASIISSAQSHTHFLDSVRLAAAMSASSLSLSDLRRRPTTLYLVLPSERLSTDSSRNGSRARVSSPSAKRQPGIGAPTGRFRRTTRCRPTQRMKLIMARRSSLPTRPTASWSMVSCAGWASILASTRTAASGSPASCRRPGNKRA